MSLRAAILFVALAILATGTFADANAWIEPLPAIRALPFAARIAMLYVPYVVLVAVLWAYARLGPRVRGHIALYVVVAALAVTEVFTDYAAPALMLAVAVALLQSAPRVGSLYEATSFPSIRAFFGLTLLAAVSVRWGADILGMEWVEEELQRVPRQALALVACAAGVAAFIVAARLRHRRVQPCGAAAWLTFGIVACLSAAATGLLASNLPHVFFAASALMVAAHFALFIGAFLLLSHLLPYREADHKH